MNTGREGGREGGREEREEGGVCYDVLESIFTSCVSGEQLVCKGVHSVLDSARLRRSMVPASCLLLVLLI